MATRNHTLKTIRCAAALMGVVLPGLIGCHAFQPTVDEASSRTVQFVPGAPNFDMDAVAAIDGMVTAIDVYMTAPLATLTFVDRGSAFEARVQTVARALSPRGRRLLAEEAWIDTISVPTYEDTQLFEVWPSEKRLTAAPGRYVIEVVMESLDSGASAVRRQVVEIPDPASDQAAFSGIRLSVRRGEGGFVPFVSVQIPADFDSLQATVTLIRPEEGMDLEMRLLRYVADTSSAGAPFEFAPTYFDLRVMGVDYGAYEVVQHTRRRLINPDRQVEVVFSLPPLDPGAYGVEVVASTDSRPVLQVNREFSVLDAAFPRVETIDQMIDALVYIARRREFRELRAPGTPEERRSRFDAFWGSLIPNRQEAAAVMKQYYSRVEEANILFSNFKEGWKTDRGMILIVLGMPLVREMEPRGEIWRYSLTDRLIPDYRFERVTHPTLHAYYPHFMLRRSQHLEESWSRAVDRWRTGRVL